MFSIIADSDMYKVLDTKIMDRVIDQKWNGGHNETKSIVVYSTAYEVMNN